MDLRFQANLILPQYKYKLKVFLALLLVDIRKKATNLGK
jgi:hypothetical protein